MVTIRPRSSWTTQPFAWSRFPSRLFSKSRVVTLAPHYPAIAGTIGVLSPAEEEAWLRMVRGWHVSAPRNWADIGYGLGLGQSGRLYMAGGITHSTAHAGTANSVAIGVIFMVGNDEEPSAAAIASFNALGRWLRTTQGFTALARVRDHGRLTGADGRPVQPASACAGQPIRRAIDAGRLTITGGAPVTKRRPTKADLRNKEAELRRRGFDIYCGPSYVADGRCRPGRHSHSSDSRHWAGLALDVGKDPANGAPISDYEKAHMDLLHLEFRADPHIDWRLRWLDPDGGHTDHLHVDDRPDWFQTGHGLSGALRHDGTRIFIDPRAFPNHVPPTNRDGGFTLASGVQAQTLMGQLPNPATGRPFYTGAVDGYLGTGSRTAARAVQTHLGLTVDGRPGPATVAAMRKALEAPTPDPQVRSLQTVLRWFGQDIKADGLRGDATQAAVRAVAALVGYTGPTDTPTLLTNLEDIMSTLQEEIRAGFNSLAAQVDAVPRNTANRVLTYKNRDAAGNTDVFGFIVGGYREAAKGVAHGAALEAALEALAGQTAGVDADAVKAAARAGAEEALRKIDFEITAVSATENEEN